MFPGAPDLEEIMDEEASQDDTEFTYQNSENSNSFKTAEWDLDIDENRET